MILRHLSCVSNLTMATVPNDLLPKSREDVHTALDGMTIETSKSENICLINDQESGIIIFSCTSNLRVLCTQVEEIFIDGTFKCCAKYFEQLYTVHGFRNGHYVPLIFTLVIKI
jgi:hypothetical protein